MNDLDRANLERVVPGPEYPEALPRSAAIIPWTLGMAVVIVAVLLIVAAASRGAPEFQTPQKSAPSAAVGAEGLAQALLGVPHLVEKDTEVGTPPTVDRYRGTATWYCLSGSSSCTSGYGQDDLVAAIDTDLGFGKGDAVTVRYRDRAVTVTVVDVCGCPGERLIDLTSGAFSRLAPLGHGVIPVTVELAGPSSTLPATETKP